MATVVRSKAPGAPAAAQQHSHDPQLLWQEARRSIGYGVLVLLVSAAGFALFVRSMPPLKEEEISTLMASFPPKSVQSVALVRDTILNYAETYPKTVALALLMLYVIMQSFAIPGTVSLSLLSGALYGSMRGFALVALISTLGSTSCYCLSWLIGRPIAHAIWKERLADFSQQVTKRKNDLLNYMIFLRVTPILPNTFINVAAPVVGVPLAPFFFGTLIGCLPNNFMAAHAGNRLSELNSMRDLYDPKIVMLGLTVGGIALIPVYVKHRHERTEARKHQEQQEVPGKVKAT